MEMEKLAKLLDEANVPYEVNWLFGTKQIIYPNEAHHICDAVCHPYSYGSDRGLLEIMGLVGDDTGDDVEGYLTAEEVAERIIKHFNENKSVILPLVQ